MTDSIKDICPACGHRAMPPWSGTENARACAKCGHVEDRKND